MGGLGGGFGFLGCLLGAVVRGNEPVWKKIYSFFLDLDDICCIVGTCGAGSN